MDVAAKRTKALEMAKRLRELHPDARYELDYSSPFELLVGTILAGGSKDASVNLVTPAVFARWPTPKMLARAELEAIEELLRPLGLARQKATRLVEVASELVDRFGGNVPRTMDEMLTLPGVQRKTANVVLTNALDVASGIVVDLHVARVSQRIGLSSKKKPEAIEADLVELLPSSSWIHFGAATIMHGRYLCTAQAPQCSECPLGDLCEKNGVDGEAAQTIAATPPSPAPAHASSGKSAWPDDLQLPEEVRASTKKRGGSAPAVASGLPPDWATAMGEELAACDLDSIVARVAEERARGEVFPPADEVFSAFHLTPFAKARVIILGQDPYHAPGQAHGLAFSVKPGVKPPPSLVNVYKELQADLGCTIPASGWLEPWARQGVLLLNTVLTVKSGEPNSHKGFGWETFTDRVIAVLSKKADHLVVVLWGNHARKKARLVDPRHTVIEGAHPSPLSVKQFLGSRPFSKVNTALRDHAQAEIDWQL